MTTDLKLTLLTYCARSGSTLVAQRLSDGLEGVVVVPEFRLIQMLAWRSDATFRSMTYRQCKKFLKQDFQIGNLGLSDSTLSNIARLSSGRTRSELLKHILEAYKQEHSLTGDTFVVKNGQAIYEVKELTKIAPQLKVLNVSRDPRGVINSMLSTRTVYSYGGAMAGSNALTAANLWKQHSLATFEVAETLVDRFHEVKYEAFVQDEESQLSKLGMWLGCPKRSGVPNEASASVVPRREQSLHALVTEKSQQQRIDAWKTSLSSETGVFIENVLGEMMAVAGYQLHFQKNLSQGEIRQICQKQNLYFRRQKLTHLLRNVIFTSAKLFSDFNRLRFLVEQRLRKHKSL